MDYFNVSREELFNNEETESIIVKKNVSISRLKKISNFFIIGNGCFNHYNNYFGYFTNA